MMKCKFCNNEIPNESVYCPICGNQVGLDNKEGSKAVTIVFIIITAILLAFSVFTSVASKHKDDTILSLQKEANKVEALTNESKKSEEMLKDIVKIFTETPPITYYEDNFQINEGTVVLKEFGTSHVLNLTAWWWNNAEVTVESSDTSVVSIFTEFAEDNKTADITLTPHSAGIATITVSTTRYDNILRAVVIVQPK